MKRKNALFLIICGMMILFGIISIVSFFVSIFMKTQEFSFISLLPGLLELAAGIAGIAARNKIVPAVLDVALMAVVIYEWAPYFKMNLASISYVSFGIDIALTVLYIVLLFFGKSQDEA
ncbi:MAG: hypothetical protein ACOX6J_03145 [Oscillospiraceae bacterium]|jgi:hypothetical protein